MRVKKSITIIITLILIILPMMTTPIQAVTLGTVYNLTSEMKGNTVYFSWSSVTNADGYDLYINTSNSGYQYIGSVNSTTAAVIGFQANETYLAKVCAYKLNSNGTKQTGSFSTAITVNTKPSNNTLAKVTTLTATQNGGIISLSWSKVSNATGYQIFADVPGWGYINLGSVDGANSTFIGGAKNGETYYFKVRAYRNLASGITEYGEFSPERRVYVNNNQYDDDPGTPEVNPPAQVKNLYLYSLKDNKAEIDWTNISDAEGYEIYLAKGNGAFYYMSTVYNNYATLSNLDYNTTYKVKVRAYKYVNGYIQYGDYSSILTFTTGKNNNSYVIESVQNLYVNVENNKAYLDWTAAKNAQSYEIYLAKGNGSFQLIDTVYNNYATLSNLDYNTTYRVKVASVGYINGIKQYGQYYSPTQTFTTATQNASVDTVRNLYVDVEDNTAYLDWTAVSGASGYEVYVAKENGAFYRDRIVYNNYATLASLSYNTTYKVKVRAYKYVNNYINYGEYSQVKTFTTTQSVLNTQVTGLTVSDISQKKATISWNKISGVDGYNIYLSTNNTRNFKFLKTTTARSATIEDLDYATTYYVKVCAYKFMNGKEVEGPASEYRQFTTKERGNLGQVTHLSAEVENRNEAYLYWWPVDEADGYEVYLAESGRSFEKVDDTDIVTTIIYSNELDYNTSYQVKVRAYEYVNGVKKYGSYSSTVSFRTESESATEGNDNVPRVRNVVANVVGDTVTLTWDKVAGAVKYDVYFTVPGLGGVGNFSTDTNSKIISGLTDKEYNYTARVRAYKYVNGRLVSGPYSYISRFTGK